MIRQLKRRLFPRGVRRELLRYQNMIFRRTTRRKLRDVFRPLEIPAGAVVCVHSMLSGLGYLVGGPETVIRAVRDVVPDVTIMMPTFPFSGTMDAYLAGGEVYDRRRAPSKSGFLTETLRRMEGARRSLHPTHPCAAIGPGADDLIDGSENSETPFGDASSYGKLSEMDEAHLLLIHTNSSSIVHRIQEMVHMPNLFRQTPVAAKSLMDDGEIASFSVFPHISVIPLYVVVPGARDGRVDYMWFPDYAMLFPAYNRDRILAKLTGDETKRRLIQRHERFLEKGIYRVSRFGDAEIWLIHLKPWLESIRAEVRGSLKTYSEHYSFENMKKALDAGLLRKEI